MSSISSTLRPIRNGFRYLLDRRFDDQRALRERRAAPADEARLGGFDFHDDQADAIRRGEDGLDVADLDRRGALHRLRVARVGCRRERVGQESLEASSEAPPARESVPSASRRFILVLLEELATIARWHYI